MKNTAVQAIPYPEPGDHTRTWEYWQSLADRMEALLTNGFQMLSGDLFVGDPASVTGRMVRVRKLDGASIYEGRLYVQTGGAIILVWYKDNVEMGRVKHNPDGSVTQSSNDRPIAFGQWTGVATVVMTSAASGTVAVTFPSGRFTVPPNVVATTSGSNYFATLSSVTATGVTIAARHCDNVVATANVNVQIQAVQSIATGPG